ncbi:MAG: ABC transporter ATP-binding protein [Pseudonocardia sp.]|nr:ABC transporter ATP-binding protein [Pseudonocardia sp.]
MPGGAAVTDASSALLPVASAGATWALLGRELRGRLPATAATLAVGLLAAGASVLSIYQLGVLVDELRADSPPAVLVPIGATIAATAVVAGIGTGLSTYLISRLGEQLLADLRERTVARVLALPVTTLERAGTGDLLARVGADVATIKKAVTDVVPTVLSSVLLSVLTVVGMAGIDWRFGLVGLVAVPLYVVALRWYLPRSAPAYARERVAESDRSQHLVESMLGRTTVHAYRLEAQRLAGIDEASARVRDISVSVFALFTRFVGRVNRAEFVGLTAIVVAGYLLVRDGAVQVGGAAAAALLFHRLFTPIGSMLFSFDDVQEAGAALARLVGVLDVADAPVATAVLPAVSAIEVDGVRFSYDGRTEVLHGIDLRVAPGERVALVGSTGAGKSTLAAIMAGLLTPAAGSARIGGIPAVELRRDQVVIISQETHVFAGPLLEDLRLGRPDATGEQVMVALRTVGAGDWVAALPDGLATEVGAGGHDLTAAQAGQLALARVVLADPPVAILDEATAEAGSLGARDLEAAAAAATAGRTTVIVAHRLTQAAAADRVVVLEHGRIVEQGGHVELVAAGGRYAQLWAAWQSRVQVGEVER